MHGAEPRRAGVAILNAGGGDLTYDRQAHCIDGDMSLAARDFLAGVNAARPARKGAVTTRRAGFDKSWRACRLARRAGGPA
jgi:hypothetical protein